MPCYEQGSFYWQQIQPVGFERAEAHAMGCIVMLHPFQLPSRLAPMSTGRCPTNLQPLCARSLAVGHFWWLGV